MRTDRCDVCTSSDAIVFLTRTCSFVKDLHFGVFVFVVDSDFDCAPLMF